MPQRFLAYNNSAPTKRGGRRRSILPAVIALIALVNLVAILLVLKPGGGAPSLEGMELGLARQEAAEHGCELLVEDSVESPEPGVRVLGQSGEGDVIRVTVSRSPMEVVVPDVTGLSPQAACELLKGMGIAAHYPPGTGGVVVEQSAPADSRLGYCEELSLTLAPLADGQEPSAAPLSAEQMTSAVPDFTFVQREKAVLLASRCSLELEFDYRDDDTAADGLVLAQSALPGELLPVGSTVTLTLCRNPECPVSRRLVGLDARWGEGFGFTLPGKAASAEGLSIQAVYSDGSRADVTGQSTVTLPEPSVLGWRSGQAVYTEDGVTVTAPFMLEVVLPDVELPYTSVDIGYKCRIPLEATVNPSGARQEWSVSDDSVAEITEDGHLVGKKVGSCTLTVTVEGLASAQCTVNVRKVVYITIDDGPTHYTDGILTVLERHKVKATFFVRGSTGRAQSYKDIVEGGHALGLHSYTHEYDKCYASADAFMDECSRLQDLIEKSAGIRPMLVRFPGGTGNTVSKASVMEEIVARLNEGGYMYCDWTLSSRDAGSSSTDFIYNCIRKGCYDDREIILMHDKAGTATVLNRAIPLLKDRGYIFEIITMDTVPVHTSIYANRK